MRVGATVERAVIGRKAHAIPRIRKPVCRAAEGLTAHSGRSKERSNTLKHWALALRHAKKSPAVRGPPPTAMSTFEKPMSTPRRSAGAIHATYIGASTRGCIDVDARDIDARRTKSLRKTSALRRDAEQPADDTQHVAAGVAAVAVNRQVRRAMDRTAHRRAVRSDGCERVKILGAVQAATHA